MPSLNPLTLIEELINEHGSSKIQGVHLALLRDQISIRKEQRAESDRQISELSRRAERVEAENANLRRQIRELTAAAERQQEQEQEQNADLPEIQQNILHALATSRDGPNAYQLAQHFRIGEQAVRFHLSELYGAQLAFPENHNSEDSGWFLTHNGRRYLMKRGLLK